MLFMLSHMVIKGKPCKVINVSTSKTGKHGHAKCNFTAVDIFTDKKYEDIIPSTHTAHVPVVVRKEYTLIDISEDGFLTMMEDNGDTREDLKLPTQPDGYDRTLQKEFDEGKELVLMVVSAMGTEQVMSHKEVTA